MVGALPSQSDSNIVILSSGDSRSRNDINNMSHGNQAVIGDDVRPPLCVGSRVRCEDSIGTIKYIGEVQGYTGTWYGVDWDSGERGKHDGSVGGVRYFQASGPRGGSFVRGGKIAPSVSCAHAIWKCYGETEDENTAALCKAVIEDWKREIKVPFIEMVGFDSIRKKQSNLSRLVEACVSDMNVSHAGDLTQLCPSIRLLDLSRNLLPDWRTVADIARQLPHLERLDLRNNRLSVPETDNEALEYSQAFPSLHKVIMTHCGLEWGQVRRISLMLPALRELVLAFNQITHIQPDLTDNLSHITQLILDSNPLTEWTSIMTLRHVDSLRVLCLNECRLKEVRLDDTYQGEKTDCFRNLEVLHLKWNLISDWRSVSELNKLRKLEKLFLWKNPVTDNEENYDTCSQLIIARIEHLKELNGSEIPCDMRRGAEYDYIKRHGKQWKTLTESCSDHEQNPSQELIDFYLTHSRYQQLITKYGVPDDSLLEIKSGSDVIRTRLIEIVLKDEESGQSFKKKVPSTIIVQKLVVLARRMFPSAASRGREPILYSEFTSKSDAGRQMRIQLENHLKELEFYSIGNGDTIIFKWS